MDKGIIYLLGMLNSCRIRFVEGFVHLQYIVIEKGSNSTNNRITLSLLIQLY